MPKEVGCKTQIPNTNMLRVFFKVKNEIIIRYQQSDILYIVLTYYSLVLKTFAVL